jgi:hypothetical protein
MTARPGPLGEDNHVVLEFGGFESEHVIDEHAMP